MNFKHNKKRNVGLLAEFFSLHISSAVLQQNEKEVDRAIALWKKYLAPGTELNKEYLAFKSLYEARLKNKDVADRLLNQVKTFVRQQNTRRLEEERTAFIQEVNFGLKDEQFWHRPVNDYKICASIQVLFNHWRGQSLLETVQNAYQLEDTVLEWVMSESKQPAGNPEYLNMTQDDISGLVFELMTKKFNSKYADALNEDQKDIVKLYFGTLPEHRQELSSKLNEMKSVTFDCIDRAHEVPEVKKPLLEKLHEIKNLLNEYDVSNPTDETIKFYMSVAKLEKEFFND